MKYINKAVKDLFDSYQEGGFSSDETTLSNSESTFLIETLTFVLFPPSLPQEKLIASKLETLIPLIAKIFSNICLSSQEETELFIGELVTLRKDLLADAAYILASDPAADSLETIIKAYPGFKAITIYRIGHYFYQKGAKKTARLLCEMAHNITGIDIHPGAQIESPFMIDHGTGIVIGETAVVGKYVKIYQGVTLGALSVKKSAVTNKRHPTIGDHVTIYAQATILGGETVIGESCVIGGNVWLVKSVPAHSKVLAIFDHYKLTKSKDEQ